ncbi:hypothetical protein Q3A86_21220 [Streptomyces sp. NBUA17]|uniref:hypothetical protein n=1 Tax=Streptomyces sp. NBUA17 TaxID=3062275 RepID=UPI0037D99FCF
MLNSFTEAHPERIRIRLQQIEDLHVQMKSCFQAPAPYVRIRPTRGQADRYQKVMIQRNQRIEDLTGVKISYQVSTVDWTGPMLEGWRQCQRVQDFVADCGLQWPAQDAAVSMARALPRLLRGPQDAFRAVPFNTVPEEAWQRREAELDDVDIWLAAMAAVLDSLPGLTVAPAAPPPDVPRE